MWMRRCWRTLAATTDPTPRTSRDALRTAGEFAAPDLVDVETTSVLCKEWLATISDSRFELAVEDLERLNFERAATLGLMRRAYELRANVSAYDAAYVALAERLGCELLTADHRRSRTTGPRCAIRALPEHAARAERGAFGVRSAFSSALRERRVRAPDIEW